MNDVRMAKRFKRGIAAILKNENGATITEYVLVTAFVGLAALVIFKLLPLAIRAYVGRIYFVVSLPLP